jgi:hypothetical protein
MGRISRELAGFEMTPRRTVYCACANQWPMAGKIEEYPIKGGGHARPAMDRDVDDRCKSFMEKYLGTNQQVCCCPSYNLVS